MPRYTILASSIIIFGLFSVAVANATSLEIYDGSVVGLYHLEDVVDSSGNGYNLTNNNSVTFVSGLLSNAASTTRALSQDLDIGNDMGINGNAISFSAWVKPTSQPGTDERYLIAWQSDLDPNTEYYLIEYYDIAGTKGLRGYRQKHGVGGSGASAAQTLTTDTWYHIVMTYDQADIKVYVNNSLLATGSATGTAAAALVEEFAIGSQYGSGAATDFFNGLIDEVVVFNTGIDTDTITALYNNGAGIEVCTTVGCGTEPAIDQPYTLDEVSNYTVVVVGFLGITLLVGIAIKVYYL